MQNRTNIGRLDGPCINLIFYFKASRCPCVKRTCHFLERILNFCDLYMLNCFMRLADDGFVMCFSFQCKHSVEMHEEPDVSSHSDTKENFTMHVLWLTTTNYGVPRQQIMIRTRNGATAECQVRTFYDFIPGIDILFLEPDLP